MRRSPAVPWWVAAGLVAVSMLVVTQALSAGTTKGQQGDPAFVIHRVDEARLVPSPSEPFFAVVIGSDARVAGEQSRGDALHLIGVNPGLGRATILNIPRDTLVTVPGRGRTKINDAFAAGGAVLQAKVVGDLVGVPVAFAVTTTFEGLTAMVDELGGVDVDVPIAMDDSFSGAQFAPGRTHMDGRQALAFSRNRHIPDGDIRRTEDQGILILAALAKLRADTSAAGTLRDLSVLLRHSRVEGFGLGDVYRVARMAVSFDPANVRSVTMPSSVGEVGGASVVFPAAGASALFSDFRDDAVLQSR